jgi:hypothetical protein
MLRFEKSPSSLQRRDDSSSEGDNRNVPICAEASNFVKIQ